jgi:uracil-DNA glycosylase
MALKAVLDSESRMGADVSGMRFAHGAAYTLAGGRRLYVSYHPSPRNTNTGKLTESMLVGLLQEIKAGIAEESNHDKDRQVAL